MTFRRRLRNFTHRASFTQRAGGSHSRFTTGVSTPEWA